MASSVTPAIAENGVMALPAKMAAFPLQIEPGMIGGGDIGRIIEHSVPAIPVFRCLATCGSFPACTQGSIRSNVAPLRPGMTRFTLVGLSSLYQLIEVVQSFEPLPDLCRLQQRRCQVSTQLCASHRGLCPHMITARQAPPRPVHPPSPRATCHHVFDGDARRRRSPCLWQHQHSAKASHWPADGYVEQEETSVATHDRTAVG